MSYSAMRRKRFTAGVLAGALALTVTPILGLTGTAGALEPATGDGSVCEDAPEAEPFTDVSEDDPSNAEIECLVNTGITTGVTETTYEPNSPVTRRQMALFLVRLADVIEENAVAGQITPLPDGDGVTTFTDIADEAAEIQAAIDRLADSDIAQGVTATEFMPASNVTRRQMAKFIVRLQEFMAGEAATPDDAPNAFTDDEGDSGEAELNILAAEGVFLGDGAGNVNPGEDISRRQMANVIVRKAQYLFEQGDITRLFAEDDTNQTLSLTPQEGGVLAFDEQSATFQVTGLNNSDDTHVALFNCEDVIRDGALISFADVGDDGEADNDGAYNGDITGPTGAESGSTFSHIAVVNGQTNFSFNGDSFGCTVAVIWEDLATTGGDDHNLDLDANNMPTEPFAVTGEFTILPAEAASGSIGATDADILLVNREGDTIYTGANAYMYDANDLFYVNAGAAGDEDAPGVDAADQVTMAEFEAQLSAGDQLDDSTVYLQNDALSSTFVLEDLAPVAPTINSTDAATTSITATIEDSDLSSGATVTVNVFADGANPATATPVATASSATDADTTTADFQITVSGLTANTAYDVYAVQTSVEGETSDPSAKADVTTDAVTETVAPTVVNTERTTDAGTLGVLIEADGTSDDVIVLDFSEAMEGTLGDTTATFLRLTDGTDVFQVTCDADVTNDDTTDACDLQDGPSTTGADDQLEIDLSMATISRISGAGSLDLVSETVTVSFASAAFDDVAGNQLNLAGSADVEVDDEP